MSIVTLELVIKECDNADRDNHHIKRNSNDKTAVAHLENEKEHKEIESIIVALIKQDSATM